VFHICHFDLPSRAFDAAQSPDPAGVASADAPLLSPTPETAFSWVKSPGQSENAKRNRNGRRALPLMNLLL
jgi:hypothetical protein